MRIEPSRDNKYIQFHRDIDAGISDTFDVAVSAIEAILSNLPEVIKALEKSRELKKDKIEIKNKIQELKEEIADLEKRL